MKILLFLLIVLAAALKPISLETLQEITVGLKDYKTNQFIGSGVFINKNTILTASHVIRNKSIILVKLDDREVFGEVAKCDKIMDLITIVVAGKHKYAYLRLNPRLGEQIYAVASVLHHEDVVSFGRVIKISSRECLVTDAKILPGNSGGGIFDTKGRLLGLMVSMYGSRGGGDWLNESIPAKEIKKFLEK